MIPRNMRHPREAPAWLKHDKQVLRFYGFFQETVTERPDENARYRHVSIMFHMEDGTMSMHEPKVENSGLAQGPFLKRQKVMRQDGMAYLGPDDLKVGQEITIYGRTIHTMDATDLPAGSLSRMASGFLLKNRSSRTSGRSPTS